MYLIYIENLFITNNILKYSYYKQRITNAFLCAVFLQTIIFSQNNIETPDFMYSTTDAIPIIIDEAGQNTFFLNIYNPTVIQDFKLDDMFIDGALHIPYGSYYLSNMAPVKTVPDSIYNYSQIHYISGDYESGELGISLDIEGKDSSLFRFVGFRKTPPVIHTALSWEDELQNYFISYKQFSPNHSVSANVMYHFENYHLPLYSEGVFNRNIETFHGALGVRKKWKYSSIESNPAFQISHTNNDMIPISSITLWNDFLVRFTLSKKFFIFMKQNSKILIVEKDNQIHEVAEHLFRPMIQYNFGNLILDLGITFHDGSYDPEINILYLYSDYYFSANHNFYSHFETTKNAKFKKNNYSLSSFDIGYIGGISKIELGVFQTSTLSSRQLGFQEKIELDVFSLRLSQRGALYHKNNNNPINAFSNLSILFFPPSSIFPWEAKQFQPFIGVDSYYLLHSNSASIIPHQVPIYSNKSLQVLDTHVLNMKVGILVNRFKLSFRWGNLLNYPIRNSNSTKPLQSINELEVEWQFWN